MTSSSIGRAYAYIDEMQWFLWDEFDIWRSEYTISRWLKRGYSEEENPFGASRGSVDGLAAFRASRGPGPSADGQGHPRIIHLMQNRLPCIIKTAS